MADRVQGFAECTWKQKLWVFRELCGVKWMSQNLVNYNEFQILTSGSGSGEGMRTVGGMREYALGHWPGEDVALPDMVTANIPEMIKSEQPEADANATVVDEVKTATTMEVNAGGPSDAPAAKPEPEPEA